MDERRAVDRIEVSSFLAASVKSTVPVRVLDISRSGARVEIPTALRPSVCCRFTLLDDSGEIVEVRARVRRCRIRQLGTAEMKRTEVSFIAGLEFLPMNRRTRRKLDRLLRNVKEGTASVELAQ